MGRSVGPLGIRGSHRHLPGGRAIRDNEDFAEYTAEVEAPVSVTYRGYTASQGPAELRMGLDSADYIHTSAEAIKLARADRDTYLGDIDFVKIRTKVCRPRDMRQSARS